MLIYLCPSCSFFLKVANSSLPLSGCSDTFQAQQRLPLIASSRTSKKTHSEVEGLDVLDNEVTPEIVNGADVYGTGLKNEVGEYNCFLNVIIQVGYRK